MGNTSYQAQSDKEVEKQVKIFNSVYQGKGGFKLRAKHIKKIQEQVLFEYPFFSNVFGLQFSAMQI